MFEARQRLGSAVYAGRDPLPSGGQLMTVDPASMLAADTDRERAVDIVKAGFAEGRLTRDEHDERVTKLNAARTYGELAALTADLPAGPLGAAGNYPVAAYYPVVAYQPTRALAVVRLILGWAILVVFFAAVAGIMFWLMLPPGPGTGGPIGG
jgi:hypothetical protein